MNRSFQLAAILCTLLSATAGATRAEPPGQVDPDYSHASPEAYESWRDLKYGLRIHWGYYSLLGVEASWPVRAMSNEKKQEYFELYRKFNPVDFDAYQWMDLLERCGFTYFTITTKHHDGFSLWDTKTRVKRRVNYAAPGGPRIEDCDLAYSVMDAPIRRDLIKELTAAARERGIAVDLYFSHIDWYDADFRMDHLHPFHEKNYSREKDPEGYARMIQRHRQQILELLGNYGKVDMMCLDIRLPDFCWPDLKETIKLARRVQPDVLLRQRGIGAYGDYQTPENWIPSAPGQKDRRVVKPWMVIHTLSDQFAYDPHGHKYKSGQWIVSSLIDIVSKGGNFMVSIGPDAEGNFHPEAIERLEYAGEWLEVNGEAIYRTRPFEYDSEGEAIRFTRSKDRRHVYAISTSWPGKELVLESVRAKPDSKIYLLGVERALEWRHDEKRQALVIDIPAKLQKASNRPCAQAWSFKIEGTPSESRDKRALPEEWPPGTSPTEVGKRVAAFTVRHLEEIKLRVESIYYQNVCCAYGVLLFSEASGDDDLRKRVEAIYAPYLSGEKKDVRNNYQGKGICAHWFGFVPFELWRQTGKREYLALGRQLAEEQFANPRDDGLPSYTRMWVDDMYGMGLLQGQASKYLGEAKYADRGVHALLVHARQLQQPDGLFHHATGDAAFFWGRGNGWAAAAMTELLLAIPQDHPKRGALLDVYRKQMQALVKYQQKSGAWRQLIDHPGSWLENSGSAMFVFALATGVDQGWLPPQPYTKTAARGWLSLAGSVDPEGRLHEVCVGTGKRSSAEKYLGRPRVPGDPHGQGPLLWAAAAMLRLDDGP